jgi:hypothetical protein
MVALVSAASGEWMVPVVLLPVSLGLSLSAADLVVHMLNFS